MTSQALLVLSMIALVPVAGTKNPGHFERATAAVRIATAIAEATPDLEKQALLVVYGAYESAFEECLSGDDGRSLGFLQLQSVSRDLACNPKRAAVYWLGLATLADRQCAPFPVDDRLALLASGYCDRARPLARERARLAHAIAVRARASAR